MTKKIVVSKDVSSGPSFAGYIIGEQDEGDVTIKFDSEYIYLRQGEDAACLSLDKDGIVLLHNVLTKILES